MIFIKNIEGYNPNEKRKILIVFDEMIADMLSNKKLNPVVTGFFIRDRKPNFSCVYYTILFCCAIRYYTKLYSLFYYQNFK